MTGQSKISVSEYAEFVAYLESKKIPETYDVNFTTRQGFLRRTKGFSLNENNQLCKTVKGLIKIFVCSDDEDRISNLVQLIHEESGHRGRDEVFRRISESYVGISKEKVAELLLKCQNCKYHTPLTSNPGIIPIRAFYPWERIQLDMVDLRQFESRNNGYKYILNLIDCFSKYVFSVPLRQKDADSVFNFLEELFLTEGYPYIIHTDNGREFKNSKIQALCREKRIRFIHGSPRRPTSQGQIERVNQTISRSLVKSCFRSQVWYKSLKNVVANYNRSFHRAIEAVPFEIFRGRKFLNNNAEIIHRINLLREDDSPSLFEDEDVPENNMEISQNTNLENFYSHRTQNDLESAGIETILENNSPLNFLGEQILESGENTQEIPLENINFIQEVSIEAL